MACYHPIPAYYDPLPGKLILWPPLGEENIHLPCAGCLGCKTDRALDWARRAVHEAKSWENNCFLTLTYNDRDKPSNGALVPAHLRDFIKRLRQRSYRGDAAIARSPSRVLRYLACGEYGDLYGRPHYHLCLFNCDFNDKYEVANDLYESPLLNKLWEYGHHRLGTLTGASANYVAQYTVKKIGQKVYHTPDGEILPDPFIRVSLKPPLGTKWLTKYKNDLANGYLVTEGTKGRIPRAYKQRLVQLDPALAEQVIFKALEAPRTKQNLEAAEVIHARRIQLRANKPG